ncbi:MAG TPA: hypothetical protein VF103_05480 [Polyangiaceae bacterium]
MSLRRRTLVKRDQAASSFSGILMALCEATGALGAVLVDREGEAVDYAGYLDPFALKVAAAEWRLVLDVARDVPHPHYKATDGILVRGKNKSFAVVGLPDGYALVVELPRRSFGISGRAVAEAVRAVEIEAQLGTPEEIPASERWLRVEVRTAPGDRRRPEAVWLEGSWRPLVILGRHGGTLPTRREIAYRARLPTGLEFTLVRESSGHWFADAL